MEAPAVTADSRAPKPPPVRSATLIVCISAGINVITAAILVCSNFSELWSIPPGSHFRSTLPYTNLVGGAAALLQTLLLSAIALTLGWKSRRIRILVILLILLGFVPLLAAGVTFDWINQVHQLELD
jgi:ABC-type sugar transport system permease subunit